MEICAGQVCVSAAPTNLVCIRPGNTGPRMQRRNGVKNGIVAKKYVCRSFNNLYASASKKGIKMASEMDIARNMAGGCFTPLIARCISCGECSFPRESN